MIAKVGFEIPPYFCSYFYYNSSTWYELDASGFSFVNNIDIFLMKASA